MSTRRNSCGREDQSRAKSEPCGETGGRLPQDTDRAADRQAGPYAVCIAQPAGTGPAGTGGNLCSAVAAYRETSRSGCICRDRVEKGDLIAGAAEGLSANIHAGVDGVVEEVTARSIRISRREE